MSNNTPNISVATQYIKDFSFESPNAPESLRPKSETPELDVSIFTKYNKVTSENDTYELSLVMSVNASIKEQTLFIVELDYAGLFTLSNIPQEEHEVVLEITCASMLFPFARRIMYDITLDSGFPPLNIDPINFVRLYESKVSSASSSKGSN